MENAEKKNNLCSCKGIRTCAICEQIKIVQTNLFPIININYLLLNESLSNTNISSYYIKESHFQDLDDYVKSINKELNRSSDKLFTGFYKISGLLNSTEINYIINELGKSNWIPSQSGRKKQDYGPIINYKKKKIKQSDIQFPEYKILLQKKLNEIEILNDFNIDEIGNLYYEEAMGAHIDPHIDHYWIWGNRIVGINLLSDTILTFSIQLDDKLYEIDFEIGNGDVYVMSEESRYIWKHSVKKEHIKSDRIVITLREFAK
jgi:alkylated DNA repair protein alkB family protein 4